MADVGRLGGGRRWVELKNLFIGQDCPEVYRDGLPLFKQYSLNPMWED